MRQVCNAVLGEGLRAGSIALPPNSCKGLTRLSAKVPIRTEGAAGDPDIGTTDGRAVGDQLQTVACLVNAEQRAAERDLTDQTFAVWHVIHVRTAPNSQPLGTQ